MTIEEFAFRILVKSRQAIIRARKIRAEKEYWNSENPQTKRTRNYHLKKIQENKTFERISWNLEEFAEIERETQIEGMKSDKMPFGRDWAIQQLIPYYRK